MTWHDTCSDFNSRIEASATDASFNDTVFLLTQQDAENLAGDEVTANKAILALISPVFYAQFYGPLATRNKGPIEIVDGTAQGFKQLIAFIYRPNSFQLEGRNVTEVFNISYFAHKYQIRSLVSRCRQFLGGWLVVYGKELDTLSWLFTSEHGLEMKETCPAEHALVVNNCFESIKGDFETVFPDGKIKESQDLPDEEVLIKILQNTTKSVDQEAILSIVIDFYCKLVEKPLKVDIKGCKRLKVNGENEWDEKIDKIKSVVQFEKFHPGKLAGIYEKFLNKIPDQVMCKITKEISTCWKDKENFNSDQTNDDNDPRAIFSLDHFDPNDSIHHNQLKTGLQLKFKTNQNAILRFAFSEVLDCPCLDCCMGDTIIFQCEDYKEAITANDDIDYLNYFFVKEHKEATLTQRKCNQENCTLHLARMNKFHFSKGNFQVDILEVNGKPVTPSPCYTFLEIIYLIPS